MQKLFLFLLIVSVPTTLSKKSSKDKPEWAKKDIRDFTDADMERLLDQWEVIINFKNYNISLL